MAESSTITRELIEGGAVWRHDTKFGSVSRACIQKQAASSIKHLADLLIRVRDDVSRCVIIGVFGHEALRRFCKPIFDLIHQGKPTLPLTAQVSIRNHQVRRACEEKSDPVRLLCRSRRILALVAAYHLLPIRIHSIYRYAAEKLVRTTYKTAYLRHNWAAHTKYTQDIVVTAQLLARTVLAPGEFTALAMGGARG